MVWSIASVVVMMAGVGFLVWGWAFLRDHDEADPAPARDPLSRVCAHASQRAWASTCSWWWRCSCFQVFSAAFTAHYTVEGQLLRHRRVAVVPVFAGAHLAHPGALFWIATGFLAVGLFLAPLINGGKDPKFQKLGVDVLFWALVVVCVGSFIGNYLAIAQVMPPSGTSGSATRATNTWTWAACGRSASSSASCCGWC
jgi:nitric oxide reductase subunit B